MFTKAVTVKGLGPRLWVAFGLGKRLVLRGILRPKSVGCISFDEYYGLHTLGCIL